MLKTTFPTENFEQFLLPELTVALNTEHNSDYDSLRMM